MTRYKNMSLLVCALLLLFAAPAALGACSVCAVAAADLVLPPILLWVLLAVVLFLGMSILLTWFKARCRWLPQIPLALGLVFAIIVGSTILMVGFEMLVLLLVPVGLTAFTAWRQPPSLWPPRLVRALRQTSIAAGVVLGGMILLTVYIHWRRTPVEYILRWPTTAPAHMKIKELVHQGPTGLPALRVLLKRGGEMTVQQIANQLGRVGEPRVDVPLLIDALGRHCNTYHCREAICNALKSLTRLGLDENRSPTEWRAAWAAVQAGEKNGK